MFNVTSGVVGCQLDVPAMTARRWTCVCSVAVTNCVRCCVQCATMSVTYDVGVWCLKDVVCRDGNQCVQCCVYVSRSV